MVSIKKKIISNKTYHYLQHTYRFNGKVCYKERYLGEKIPKNIDKIKKDFLEDLYHDLWYNKFDKIKKDFKKNQTKMPRSIVKKELETNKYTRVCFKCHKSVHWCMDKLGMSWEEIEKRV